MHVDKIKRNKKIYLIKYNQLEDYTINTPKLPLNWKKRCFKSLENKKIVIKNWIAVHTHPPHTKKKYIRILKCQTF